MTKHENSLLLALAAHIVPVAKKAGGKAPSERELSEHFSVSRGQVREALAILESLQIIERRAKSGIYLNEERSGLQKLAFFAEAGIPLEPQQIYEAVELRKIHEIKAAALAAERATDENFDRLRQILADSELRISEGLGLALLDRDFHLEIVKATQNSLFYEVCASFYATSGQRLPIYFEKPDRNQRSHVEHVQIFDALFARDATLAQATMNSHLRGAHSYWVELLENTDDGEK